MEYLIKTLLKVLNGFLKHFQTTPAPRSDVFSIIKISSFYFSSKEINKHASVPRNGVLCKRLPKNFPFMLCQGICGLGSAFWSKKIPHLKAKIIVNYLFDLPCLLLLCVLMRF